MTGSRFTWKKTRIRYDAADRAVYGPAMTETVIRPAQPQDIDALSALGERTFVETFVDGFGIPYPPADMTAFVAAAFSPAATRARLADPAQGWWVAESCGRLLAYANTGPNSLPHPDAQPGETELKRLYVAREAQGTGLGTALLAIALDWMTAQGAGAQWIGVWNGNLKAQKLYAAHGFEKVGEYLFPVGAWNDEEFILRRG